MPHLGPTELIIILVIVIVLFGVGRIGRIASELGKGIREFRSNLSEDEASRKDGEA
ncbi:MAG TPA: twin-arginine translocase TatA/TatE family subunit [Anaerolineales bacterium]|nr:twin-arginine translocase TatA/TatE family subunit [Anaerolineales bacterium]